MGMWMPTGMAWMWPGTATPTCTSTATGMSMGMSMTDTGTTGTTPGTMRAGLPGCSTPWGWEGSR